MDYEALYAKYLQDGCLKIENFLSFDEVEELKKGVADVVENIPHESARVFSVYGAGKQREADEYFINSGDKIGYFFENDAFNKDGKLLMDKKQALNKVGYALHWWNPIFKKHNFNQKVKDLLRNFKYKDPVVTQSMIIFKYLQSFVLRYFLKYDMIFLASEASFKSKNKPKIGEIVRPHQDSTFLYTEPPTCIGLWFPLEDATVENGCLWFVPGSHKDPVHQRFVRNPDGEPLLILRGELPHYDDDQYVPVPAKKGDCVVIHGSVVHKSGRNSTNVARTVYTYHMVEKDAEWSKENWIQPTEVLPFPSVYAN